jgi:hypothetical protein
MVFTKKHVFSIFWILLLPVKLLGNIAQKMNVFFYTVKNKKTERFALFLTKISVFFT